MFPKKKRDIASATYTFEKADTRNFKQKTRHAPLQTSGNSRTSNKKRDMLLCEQAGIHAPLIKNATRSFANKREFTHH